jgi:tellurite resistance protein TerC
LGAGARDPYIEGMTDLGSPVAWMAFVVLVLVVLGLDLGLLQRRDHVPSVREALGLSLLWIGLACAFGGWVAYAAGAETASAYFTAYVVEKSLSVDNLFVFLLVFGAMKIPGELQHRVLFWGILGALVLRAAMVFAGTALLHRFHALVYVFGGLLIVGGIRVFREWRARDEDAPQSNRMIDRIRARLPMSQTLDGHRFLTREAGRFVATPLLGALVLIELSDIVFAVDSIPAALAITDDTFVVYTSNVFAILGLRSLYFLLARVLGEMHELKLGLAGVLVFVGIKMLIADVVHIPSGVALAIIVALLAISGIAGVIRRRRAAPISSPPREPRAITIRPSHG